MFFVFFFPKPPAAARQRSRRRRPPAAAEEKEEEEEEVGDCVLDAIFRSSEARQRRRVGSFAYGKNGMEDTNTSNRVYNNTTVDDVRR